MLLMGKTSHLSPGDFASKLGAYLRYLIAANGGNEDRSGRWMARMSDGARSHDYWGGLIKGEKAMTANDIGLVASLFGMTAAEYVAHSEELADGGEPFKGDVGPHPEDYDVSTDPGEYGLAAKREPKPRG